VDVLLKETAMALLPVPITMIARIGVSGGIYAIATPNVQPTIIVTTFIRLPTQSI
jgi:hypothetical protein